MNAISGSLLWGKFHYDYDMKGKGLTDTHTGKRKFFFVIKFVEIDACQFEDFLHC